MKTLKIRYLSVIKALIQIGIISFIYTYTANATSVVNIDKYSDEDDALEALLEPTLVLLKQSTLSTNDYKLSLVNKDECDDYSVKRYIIDGNDYIEKDYELTFNNPLGDTSSDYFLSYSWDGDTLEENRRNNVDDYDISIYVDKDLNQQFVSSCDDETIANSFAGLSSEGNGGAIYNDGTITSITGDFVFNEAYTYSNRDSSNGGAIYNSGTIAGDITGNFIDNTSKSGGDSGDGGAIYNSGTIGGKIVGDFISNYTEEGSGGAIYNAGTISGDIIGDFIKNEANQGSGGAIYNAEDINGTIYADFMANTATQGGGAIDNEGYIYAIIGNFTDNEALTGSSNGGGILNSGTIESISGYFINNTAEEGGAIYNSGTIYTIEADFYGNSSDQKGGAILNSGTIYSIDGNFIDNDADRGAGINNHFGTIYSITGDFINNSSITRGGAIRNSGTIDYLSGDFIGNSSYGDGGAIFNSKIINIVADNADVNFTDNYVIDDSDNITYNAIHLHIENGITELNLTAALGQQIVFNDAITSDDDDIYDNIENVINIDDYSSELDSSKNTSMQGTIVFNDSVSNVTINLSRGNLVFGVDDRNDDATYSHGLLVESKLNISTAGILKTKADYLGNNNIITNEGTIYLEGGTLSNQINSSLDIGNSGTIYLLDDVEIDAVEIYADSLYLNVASLADDDITSLILTDGASIEVDNLFINLEDDFQADVGDVISIFESEYGCSIVYSNITITQNDYTLVENQDYAVNQNYNIEFISQIPEPSTYALVFGLMTLTLTVYKRSKVRSHLGS